MNSTSNKFLSWLTTTFFLLTLIPGVTHAKQHQSISIEKKFAELETSSDGRIGVSAINTANNQRIQYRPHERFKLQSTFKLMVIATMLKQSMTDSDLLRQKVSYKKQDLVVWSPITEKHLDGGMTISELGGAAITHSDNTAANLLMEKLGGSETVNTFARSIGDKEFQTYRLKSESKKTTFPTDLLGTSTPAAMEKSLHRLTLGNILALPQREQLLTWLKNNTTGNSRIRAGVPKNWVVGDKTGSGPGNYGITNDIGIIWPPKCSPIVAAIYFTQNKKDATLRPAVIASVTRMLINEFARTDQCLRS